MVIHYQNQMHQTMLSQGHLLHSWGNLVLIMQMQLCVANVPTCIVVGPYGTGSGGPGDRLDK